MPRPNTKRFSRADITRDVVYFCLIEANDVALSARTIASRACEAMKRLPSGEADRQIVGRFLRELKDAGKAFIVGKAQENAHGRPGRLWSAHQPPTGSA